ncbi:MAG: PaaI family thioesterase [Oscillospiraceae bacterium]|nr:PaaI family thioesterase [Oscillospiraceae bacterium]
MDLQKIKDYRNQFSPYCRKNGIYLEELAQGYAKVTKAVAEDDLNPLGFAHGGVYFAVADTACGNAVASHGYMAVTVSGDYNFMRSAKVGDTIVAEAREIKAGKTLCVLECTVKDQEGTLLGKGTFTFFLLDQKIDC